MKARVERLKNRGEELRAHGLSVSATLQLYAGVIVDQENLNTPQAEEETKVATQESR
jgi:hypothetical protein